MEKPVNLQINTSGAWRQMLRFDAANQANAESIQFHAAALAMMADDGAKLRVVMVGPIQDVLLYWHAGKGWHEPRRPE